MKYLTYDPCAGSHIELACSEALTLAAKKNSPVRFAFNGVTLKVNKRLSKRHVLRQWGEMTAARMRRDRESKAGRAAAQKRTAEVLRKQRSVNDSLAVLKDIVADHDKLMLWLKSFTEDADDIGVQFTGSRLADELEAAGYAENEHVWQKPEWFCTRERMAHYIVGQAINCLRLGMGPHPITGSFVEKYFKIQDTAANREGGRRGWLGKPPGGTRKIQRPGYADGEREAPQTVTTNFEPLASADGSPPSVGNAHSNTQNQNYDRRKDTLAGAGRQRHSGSRS